MKLKIKDIAVFAILGALMCVSDLVMDSLPNIHIIAPFIVATTVVYGWKAIFPIYVYVFGIGIMSGFGFWWIPYLYVWTVLWGIVMLLPKNMKPQIAPIVYIGVCALHGFLFGVIYSPSQALLFGFDFKQTLAWIAAGIPFDIIHGVSNFVCGILICPIITVLRRAAKYSNNN